MRTVLAVDPFVSLAAGPDEEMVAIRVERAPFEVPHGHAVQPVPLPPAQTPPWGTPEAVRERGRLLRDALAKHPAVASVLTHIAQIANGTVEPLFVRLSEGNAELINWEALCHADGQFVALDQRSPIGRISDPPSIQARPPAVLRPPVRMLAVISAFGISSQRREWDLCQQAVIKARANGLPVKLRVLVGDEKLRSLVDQEIAGGLDEVEVGPVEKTGPRLVQEIIAWEPNIVHFFCHGVADNDLQALELATASDFADRGAKSGSVHVTARQLASMAIALTNPWLLTLNCCSSGRAAKDLHSMAHRVVAAGFPASVAMVEPVDADDAHEFTRAFYTDVFRGLAKVLPTLGAAKRLPFEWVDAMVTARTAIAALHEDDPDDSHQWVLPVLYVRGVEPLYFESETGGSAEQMVECRLRASVVAEWLQSVRDEMTPERRRAVMEKTLATVPKHFWPDVDGGFGNA